jgi:iron-sulfur cluster repair protein YtfE (RIC family)
MITHAQRRSVLKAQHDRLRDLIDAVRERAAAVLSGGPEPIERRWAALAFALAAFGADLRAHLATEEELLGPILERIDAWGPVRLGLMRAEHAHQRAVLEALRTDSKLPGQELARRAFSLIADVLADMEAEERDLLAESVLRDDPLSLDSSDC